MSDSPALNAPPPGATRPATPPAAERTAGPAQLVLLLAGSCLSVLGAVLIAPVLPQMTQAFAGTPGVDVLVPVVLTAPALLIGLTAPFAGVVVDRIDRKRLLLVAMLAYAVFGTAPLYLDSLGAIVVSRVLVGLCEGAIMTCCTTLIGDYWSGARRARYLGLQTLVATLSATAFLALGGVLGASGWRTPFWLYAVAAVLAVPMALAIWQPARPAAPAGRPAPLPWRQLFVPCLVTLFGGMVFYALIVELSFVLSGIGITSTGTIGAISALMSLATAAGAVLFGRLSGRTPRALLPVEFGLSAVGLVLVFATASPVVITLGAVLTGFGTGMLLPTLLTWAVNRLGFDRRGRGTGLWTGALFLGEFLCPLILAAVGAGVGGLQGALAVLGVASAVVGLVIALVLRRHDRPLNVTED
ncbi:MFS transporter [Pseudonocardia yuanmonensis]|uniref:MFS transporter n=1 Tax=Pseudonocardia yuanmonensis TaxID=1095914 RepID=A0ABP8X786_9PSEU